MNDGVFDPEVDAAEHERFAQTDAAYVLDALEPNERRAYEEHLTGCPLCQAQVSELAGLPDLLGRVDPLAPHAVAVPESLLPRLMSQLQRRRRHRRMFVGAALAACLLAVASLVGVRIADNSGRPHSLAMTPVAGSGTSVTASVTLTKQAGGTGLRVVCGHYGTADGGGAYPPPGLRTFRLVVINRLGERQIPTSWNADRDIRVDTGTSWPEAAIRTIEIDDATGRTVMRLQL